MANKKAAAKEVATEVAAQTTTEQAVAAAAETPTTEATQEAPAGDEAAATENTEVVAVAEKRARNYSQTAVDVADLERLNQLKVFVKEKLKVTISNQRIIAAALDCLGNNVEAFLNSIVEESNNKKVDKERKEYLALKAKFEAMEAPKEEAAEAPAAE